MNPDQDPYTTLAVAIGRIEEGIRALNDKLDKVDKTTGEHADTLSGHEARLAVLESKQGPRIHPVTVVAGIAATVAVILAVLNRLYPA